MTKIHRDPRGGDVVALRGAMLDVADGELVVVLGPSGSGKTTLLRLIAGLEVPTSGEIGMGGRSLSGVAPQDRGVAMVFQEHPLFPHLDVAGNLALGLQLRRVSKDEQARRIGEVIELLGLSGLRARMPASLSGGERQRVALGMALAQRPAVVLLDEPLAHLDAGWRLVLRREFRDLQRRLGLTWIQVTHDQTEAMALADRLVVLRGGEVQQAGTAVEVYDRPQNRFVAGFLGSPGMNLLAGRRRFHASGAWAFRMENGAEFAGAAIHEARGVGSEEAAVVLGVRPEQVRLTTAVEGDCGDTEPGWLRGDGIVATVEPVGHETWIHVRAGAGAWLVGRHPGRAPWGPGRAVHVGFAREAVHWFDASTGKRID